MSGLGTMCTGRSWSRCAIHIGPKTPVQEAFARAYADWDRVSVHPNPVGWVARVALNHAMSLWRRLRMESPEPPPPTLVAPDDERPMDSLLIGAVWRLPRRQRQVVALRILLDQSIDQTAHSLGMAPGTVRAHLHRALHNLREQLARAGHETRGITPWMTIRLGARSGAPSHATR